METNIHNKILLLHPNEEFQNNSLKNFIEGALFVTDRKNHLIGVITDGDVRKNYSSRKKNLIKDIITYNPKTIHYTENASIALRIIREEKINILPVINNENQLIGYISLHMLLKSFSPERLYINSLEDTSNENEERHLARYKFALNFIKKDAYTLDCACGSGYGSKLLATKSQQVLGVDLSKDAIIFANQHNHQSSITFLQKNLDDLDFKENSFDAIVSIETLEHIPHNVFLKFLQNIKMWLKPGGMFIGSSPMLRFKDGKPYITNPYHINEMSKKVFLDAITENLQDFQTHFYYQDQDTFLPLTNEHTGFCIIIARKK